MRISVEGGDPESARVVVVLLHGGGASALDVLALSQEFPPGDDLCWLAPQALNARWYPQPGGESRNVQEPHLTVSAKSVLGLLENHASQRLVLMGFADGAGVVGEILCDPDLPGSVKAAWLASGALVGPQDHWPQRPKLSPSLSVLLSGGRNLPDPSEERLTDTVRFFQAAGAKVTRYLYDGSAPVIHAEELKLAQNLLREVRA
jgi:predicted esterase